MSKEDATVLADALLIPLRNPRIKPRGRSIDESTSAAVDRGKRLFAEKYACQSCHTIGSAGGYVGPSLTNVGNWLTPEWMEAWLDNPQSLVSGTIEPRHPFSEDEKRDLSAYLFTLKQNQIAEKAPQGGSVEGRR